MVNSRFVLKRKSKKFKQLESDRPKIYIRPDTYALLADWNNETGLSMAELVGKAVNFAAENLEWDGG